MKKLLAVLLIIFLPLMINRAATQPTSTSIEVIIRIIDEALWAAQKCPQYAIDRSALRRYLMMNGLTADQLQTIIRSGYAADIDPAFFLDLAQSGQWRARHPLQACAFAGRLADTHAGSATLLRRRSSNR